MRKSRNIIILIIALLVIVLVVLISILTIRNNVDNNYAEINIVETEEIAKNPNFWDVQIVENANDFYTVASCVDKYIDLWYSQDNEQVYKILANDYIEENLITQDNVFEVIGNLSNKLIFRPKKMYYENLEDSVQKFYVYGTLRPEVMEGRGEEKDYYVEVILNFNNNTFSLAPLTAEEFPDNVQ